MPYPESCYIGLVGVHGTCEPKTAMYWLDDIPGVDLGTLAKLADSASPTGEKLANRLIETASRLVAADIQTIYDGRYKVEASLVNGCSNCNFTPNYATGIQRGVVIKDNTLSNFSRVLIDKFAVKINNTGTFHIVIDDGDVANQRVIEFDFTAGVEYDFTGVEYITAKKQVRLYFQEIEVQLAQLSCKRGGSGCGCSGAALTVSDLVYYGTLNNADVQQAYGFLPCAAIICNPDDLLCYMAHAAPRMIGIAVLYKSASLYFMTQGSSTRNNRVANAAPEKVRDDGAYWEKQYQAKLNGKETRGLKDVVFTTLQQNSDVCIVCNSMVGTAWATG
jgi:hypothetical protein